MYARDRVADLVRQRYLDDLAGERGPPGAPVAEGAEAMHVTNGYYLIGTGPRQTERWPRELHQGWRSTS
jgi:hypothetical protein